MFLCARVSLQDCVLDYSATYMMSVVLVVFCRSGCIVPSLPRHLGQVGASSGEKSISHNSVLW